MRIVIDCRYVQDHFPGIGRYTYNLIVALAGVVEQDTITVVHNPRLPNTRYDMGALAGLPHIQMVTCDVPVFSWREQWDLPRLASHLKADVWHAPYYIAPYRLPCPSVVTVYDTISSRYPQYLPSLRARLLYEATMRLAIASARRVIVMSQASQADLVHFFGVLPGKISVIAGAADPRYCPQSPAVVTALRSRLGLPENYVLYLGINKPHKNLVHLVEAWARVVAQQVAAQQAAPLLVIAGREDPRYAEARQRVEQLGLGGVVRFLGDVPEADLPALYSGALFFVFPSLYEGFGLPVLEAMACGTPVACSTAPALLEIVGDAAVTFDPLDTQDIAQAILRISGDPTLRCALGQRSLVQAARFSWRTAAEQTLSEYQLAIA